MGLKENIDKIWDNIERAADRAGRKKQEIELVAVTKYSDTDEIIEAYNLGLGVFGENRIQSVKPKMEKLPKDIAWHFIGHLQRNKVKYIVDQFELVHSVDSLRLAEEMDKRFSMSGTTQDILLELNLSGEMSKYGLGRENIRPVLDEILQMQSLNLLGFMTMAPFVGDEKVIRGVFAGLRELRDELAEEYQLELPHLSMGMTNDYEIAIEEGATLVRIGSAIFKGEN